MGDTIASATESSRVESPCHRQGSTNLKTDSRLAKMLIAMKNGQTTLMFLILCLASLAPLVAPQAELSSLEIEQETGGRDLIDLTIVDIAVGNSTEAAETWIQPNGASMDYLLKGTRYAANITFKNAGTGFSAVDATGTLQAVHPIGFVIQTWHFNLSLAGGQQDVQIIEWTPDAAHSIVDDDGTLHGGIIFRGMIATTVAGLGDDESNNLYEEQVPIALWHDPMEGTFAANQPIWVPISYTDRTAGQSGIYGGGSDWQTDNSSSAVGAKHWRISDPGGGNYASNTIDMLKWGWVPAGGGCDDPGHGLGYGTIDSDVEAVYGQPFCWLNIIDSDYRSVHWATMAWGTMGSGDEMAMESLRGMTTIKELNMTQAGVSASENDWTQVIWNMTDVHNDQAYTMSYSKIADTMGANSGMRIDDFILFAVEVVDEYTITLDCDDPLPNAYVVIPADPDPPSLFCTLTNNGYREVNLNIFTEVSNTSWMNIYPLRIDSDNMLDHDNYVTLNPLDGETSTTFWINLTVPEGANVETLNWTIVFDDNLNSQIMGEMTLPVSISSSFSVRLDQVSPAYPALTLAPGETGDLQMKVKNTGNQLADWTLGAYFDSTLWGSPNLEWYEDWDDDGNETQLMQMSLNKGEEKFITARFHAPAANPPGMVEISLYVQGVAPANAQSVERIYIDIPAVQDVKVTAYESSMTALADGNMRTMSITIRNDGNAPEIFDLSLDADWHIGASLATSITEPIEPFGQEVDVTVIMNMPQGLMPNFYPIAVTATSQTDSTYSTTGQFTLEVPTTYIVEVEDKDLTGQSFSAGAQSRTMNFEIFNHGNEIDAFNVALSMDDGIIAEISDGLSEDDMDGRTVFIDPQTSTNVTVSYSFDSGIQGMKELTVSATSVNGLEAGQSITATGVADFQVGSLGWIRLESGVPLHITEPGPHMLSVTVHNQHPTANQEIRLSVSTDSEADFNLRWVRVVNTDQQFELEPDAIRIINIEVYVTDENLLNLADDTMVFTATLTVEATDDNADHEILFSVDKYVAAESSEDSNDFGSLAKSIVTWTLGIILILALGVVLLKILVSTEHEDEISSLGGYESSLDLPDAPTIPDAPTLPSADTTANSMYGGTQELFAQPVMATPPPPSATPEPEPAPAAPEPAASTGPPLPASGLPEGWTMEQWEHYGDEYLRRQSGS
ncbi:MAG: hypothetical protein OSB33_02335 [Candidatus Poseidoniales archaeon]|nr:hypothetical protein [Candidatus Poseidoniales archaeon]